MQTNLELSKSPNDVPELQRTKCPELPPSDYIWDQDTFRHIGQGSVKMAKALSVLNFETKESFKKSMLEFSAKGDYAPSMILPIVSAINKSLKGAEVSSLDTAWVALAIKIPSFMTAFGAIKNFFIFWKARDPMAISEDALQLLSIVKVRLGRRFNVLSDDPEKSWLTDEEYEALLASVWRNYQNDLFSTSDTLMLLLSMQYARRPLQLAHLKISDFRIAAPDDSSGLSGMVVSFPGVKDLSAETGFRSSKFEHHPVPDHIWKLFEIQREEIRTLFELKLCICLSDSEIEMLPVFTTSDRLTGAVSKLTEHYRFDWRTNLDHQQFHMKSAGVSQVLSWRPTGRRKTVPPFSHRTGLPIVVNATRLRHTRARQLARKGVARHVLSHWMGHTHERSLLQYYNDPAEDARKLDEAIAPALMPLAMAFAGNLIDNEDQASRHNDPISRLEFAKGSELKNVGNCGKQSFCSTTSIPIPCYRCRYFEPLVTSPHEEVLEALLIRQEEESRALHIGGARNLLIPIDLSADILAVQNCIDRCNTRKIELGIA
ncbi:site-specific integrase [Halomonas sp. QX-2]|uniref:Site-specific integrase n=1 Tax=Vreelandella sedimenti TaxID=2729618 RepID=A0A7Z0N9F8_9GAMM|nr:site-specific integrase [Halomonas sedimenti]NYT73381.1 site-specific integrase [Halomonas sedimenti]